jgi:hypothetical protein
MPTDLDDAEIRRYLLGLMPEPEAEALEASYFARPGVFDRVRAVEDDLLDDYAAGRLAAADTQAFEGRYLASPALRRRVVAARALATARPGSIGGAPSPRRAGWGPQLAMAAGLVAAIGAWLLWRSQMPGIDVSPAPPPHVAGSEAPSPTPASSTPPLVSPGPSAAPPSATARIAFALSPVLLRNEIVHRYFIRVSR